MLNSGDPLMEAKSQKKVKGKKGKTLFQVSDSAWIAYVQAM